MPGRIRRILIAIGGSVILFVIFAHRLMYENHEPRHVMKVDLSQYYKISNEHNRNVSDTLDEAQLLKGHSDTHHGSIATPHSNQPVLVLCTTYPDNPEKEYLIENTFKVWSSLKPQVLPVFFYTADNSSLIELARRYRIDVYPCPKISDGKPSSCVLPAMIENLIQNYDALYYGYANGDILFDQNLATSLIAVSRSSYASRFKNTFLLVGKRSNLQVTKSTIINDSSDIQNLKSSAKLFTGYAVDYFISPKRGFPWSQLLPVAVGRLGYDNYLVGSTLLKGMVVIDLTKTVPAIHQTATEGNFAGQRNALSGKAVNYRLIGRDFDYATGRVDCAQLVTKWDSSDLTRINVTINARFLCKKAFEKANFDPLEVVR